MRLVEVSEQNAATGPGANDGVQVDAALERLATGCR